MRFGTVLFLGFMVASAGCMKKDNSSATKSSANGVATQQQPTETQNYTCQDAAMTVEYKINYLFFTDKDKISVKKKNLQTGAVDDLSLTYNEVSDDGEIRLFVEPVTESRIITHVLGSPPFKSFTIGVSGISHAGGLHVSCELDGQPVANAGTLGSGIKILDDTHAILATLPADKIVRSIDESSGSYSLKTDECVFSQFKVIDSNVTQTGQITSNKCAPKVERTLKLLRGLAAYANENPDTKAHLNQTESIQFTGHYSLSTSFSVVRKLFRFGTDGAVSAVE